MLETIQHWIITKAKTGIAVLFTDHLSDASRQFSQDCGHMITSSHATAGSGVYDRHASGCHSFGGHLGCVAFCNFTDAGNNRLLGQCQRPGRIMGHHCGVGLDLVRRLLGFIPLPLCIFIDTTGPKLYGLMLDGVSGAGRMFGER